MSPWLTLTRSVARPLFALRALAIFIWVEVRFPTFVDNHDVDRVRMRLVSAAALLASDALK